MDCRTITLMDPVGSLLAQIAQELPENRAQLRQLKTRLAAQTHAGFIRNDALLARYRQEVSAGLRPSSTRLERILRLNAIRSHSGLATVTAITEPYPCPGRCVYCPTEARAPKSYLTNEPAVRRALRHDYDPYSQVWHRLKALDETGHPTDKIELILKGGTWSFYPEAYQQWFVRRCVEAANDFRQPHTAEGTPHTDTSLEEVQRMNETARNRIIGLTVETRPDYVTPEEIRRLRQLGVTRVELGVQSLEDRILALIVRDHTTHEVQQATRSLREAGFKIAYHLMPNLPSASPEDDLATFRELFDNPAYRPDALKLYPCVVVESAELYAWWRQGRYQPYDDETLVELLIQLKMLVPPYVRIERVIRDIPSTSIQAGCTVTNLREDVHRRMRSRGLRCRCVRCREIRGEAPGSCVIVRREYEASGGREIFLSMEDLATDRLAALLRLRIPSSVLGQHSNDWPALEGAALIRELHTYGQHVSFHDRREDAAQHRGFGRQLMAEAERIAGEEFGVLRLAVIAGVGVRAYYRKLGYELEDTYMMKSIGPCSSNRSLDEPS